MFVGVTRFCLCVSVCLLSCRCELWNETAHNSNQFQDFIHNSYFLQGKNMVYNLFLCAPRSQAETKPWNQVKAFNILSIFTRFYTAAHRGVERIERGVSTEMFKTVVCLCVWGMSV